MTLNIHFTLKSVSGSAVRLSNKTVRTFAELYPYTVSDKNVAQGT